MKTQFYLHLWAWYEMKKMYLVGLVSCLSACSQSTLDSTGPLYKLSQTPTKEVKTSSQLVLLQKSTAPLSFHIWENNQINRQALERYKRFLKQQGIHSYVPNFEFFQTARDWQRCNAAEFEIPPQELWRNIVPTLNILDQLIQQQILNDFTVTSVYRNLNLNRCANGASASKHIFNAALDFRIGSANPDATEQILIQNTKVKICQFWNDHGEQLNMGLGVYPSGQIHIDSAGYRTWGADHRYSSSPCMHTFLNNNQKLDQ